MSKHWIKLIGSLLLALILYLFIPRGEISNQAIGLLSVFIFTIACIMLKVFSMGQSSIIALTLLVSTKTLSFTEAFSGFMSPVVWLIAIAFFIAKGFVKTGLGLRIAYHIMKLLGKNSLGLGYGIALTDLVIAPMIPSMTARSGGVIYPVVTSLAKVFNSEPHSHPKAIGAYLIQTAFQTTNVTGAMFLTAMAGNPLIVELAKQVGINITWALWAKVAIIPGLLALLLIPLILYFFYPPEIKHTSHAPQIAKKALKEMGPIKREEWLLIAVFGLLLVLWIFGPIFKMDATAAALIGLIFLLLTHVLNWEEIITEKSAWDTLVWFSTLVMMASYLNQLGLISVLSSKVSAHLVSLPFTMGFAFTILIYFYSHYLFASNVAHIGAMFPAFLAILIAIKTPPIYAVFILAFLSNLFGCLTHYGSGPAPILYGAGYVKVNTWWKIGFFMSLVYLAIYLGLGSVYWKILGLF